MVDAMVDEDSAIVSIYFGSDSDEDSANELAAAIEEKYPDVEVEVDVYKRQGLYHSGYLRGDGLYICCLPHYGLCQLLSYDI